MKVIITGIDGYIGTQMAQVFMKRGHDVTGIDSGFYREGWLYNGVKFSPKVITKDTREITLTDLKGFDAVISLADLSNDPLGNQDPKNTYDINHTAIVRLAKLAKKAGVKRFIYSSSCSIYGIAKDGMVDETSEVFPQTAYAKCKLLVEQDLQKLADPFFTVAYMRNATVFGPSPRMRFDLVVNNLSGIAWTEKEIRMSSDGTPWRPLVHILDVCEAFLAVLEAPKNLVQNQVFNVGNTDGNYKVREVAEIIGKVLPGCKVSFGKPDGDTRSYRVSFEKIKRTFPKLVLKRTVQEGVKDLKKVFESIALDKETFESRAYTRLKEIEHLVKTKQIDKNFFWKI
jgi:nucleoside-diphosphate-sugar epimerase